LGIDILGSKKILIINFYIIDGATNTQNMGHLPTNKNNLSIDLNGLLLDQKNSNINLTSKNKENLHTNILSNGNNNNNNDTTNDQKINPGIYSKSPIKRNTDENENNNLNIKLEELIKHLHLFEIYLEMELVKNKKLKKYYK